MIRLGLLYVGTDKISINDTQKSKRTCLFVKLIQWKIFMGYSIVRYDKTTLPTVSSTATGANLFQPRNIGYFGTTKQHYQQRQVLLLVQIFFNPDTSTLLMRVQTSTDLFFQVFWLEVCGILALRDWYMFGGSYWLTVITARIFSYIAHLLFCNCMDSDAQPPQSI